MFEEHTPMMRQYLLLKQELQAKYPKALLFYRMGDFYELFYEDAHEVADILQIALTQRSKSNEKPIPMAGVPHHSAKVYLKKLLANNKVVAIAEQIESSDANPKLMERKIIRILTPGTLTDDIMLEHEANLVVALFKNKKSGWGLAAIDVSTNFFISGEFADFNEIQDELARLNPKEIIISDKAEIDENQQEVLASYGLVHKFYHWNWSFDFCHKALIEHFKVSSLQAFDCEGNETKIIVAGALLSYIKEVLGENLPHLNSLKSLSNKDYLIIDAASRKNLEINSSINGDKKLSLFGVLNKTKTAMGGRLLFAWVNQPTSDAKTARSRHNLVECFLSSSQDYRDSLDKFCDLDRILTRVALRTATARDIKNLQISLEKLPQLEQLMSASLDANKDSKSYEALIAIKTNIQPQNDLVALLSQAITDETEYSLKEGLIIKVGFNKELDELRSIKEQLNNFLFNYQKEQQETTGIVNLKVRYNRIHGFFIEVAKSNKSAIPDDYIPIGSLKAATRYTTDSLREQQEKILNAKEAAEVLEKELFLNVLAEIENNFSNLSKLSKNISLLDALTNLAKIATDYNLVKPQFSHLMQGEEVNKFNIEGGRHLVLQAIVGDENFITNDLCLDTQAKLAVITGPNMGGKSTYMRQNALIVILAYMGSFVPASSATIPKIDKIFTRIGASDDLSAGKSTFMVEMSEAANISHNATANSFIIFDEIGRGTSTADGIAIAWSLAKYCAETLGSYCLFSTHYFELTNLGKYVKGVKNLFLDVKVQKDKIIFMHKVKPGFLEKSYGIEVASLAGIHKDIILEARKILSILEPKNQNAQNKNSNPQNNDSISLALEEKFRQRSFDFLATSEQKKEQVAVNEATNLVDAEADIGKRMDKSMDKVNEMSAKIKTLEVLSHTKDEEISNLKEKLASINKLLSS